VKAIPGLGTEMLVKKPDLHWTCLASEFLRPVAVDEIYAHLNILGQRMRPTELLLDPFSLCRYS
jgi:hypothetical protein